MKNNFVHQDDFCNPISYQKTCSTGNKRYLEKAKGLCPALLPDQKRIDEAFKQGHDLILEYIENKLGQNIPPSRQAIDATAANGKLEML